MNASRNRKLETDEELLALVEGTTGIIIHNLLSEKGDETLRLAWDPRDLEQVKEARDKFYDLIDKGYTAFAVDPDTGKAQKRKVIRYDPNGGELVLVFSDAVKAAREGRRVVAQPALVGG